MRVRLIFAAVTLVMSAPAATVQGVVTDTQNHALESVEVRLETEHTHKILTARTGATGLFIFANVEAGACTLHASAAAGGSADVGPFVLLEGVKKTINLQLKTSAAQFFDEPAFTVAGVTDNTYRGGHGSDTMLRSTESLAKAAASLSKESQPDARLDKSDNGAYEQARASMASGDYGRARTLLRELLQQRDDGKTHHLVAQCDEHLGEPLEAVREFQRAVELSPKDVYIFDWGMELLQHSTPAPAIEVFSKGLTRYPDSMSMRLGLCSATYAKGEYDRAARCFFEASDMKPNDPEPYLFLGQVQSTEITESDGYLARMARFQQLQPGNAWAKYLYAMALWKRRPGSGEVDAARVKELLDKALAIDATLAPAHLQLGMLLERQGDFEAATAEYERAVAAAPDSPEAHYRLAQCYARASRKSKAESELTRYAELSKSSADGRERERSRLKRFVVLLRDNSFH